MDRLIEENFWVGGVGLQERLQKFLARAGIASRRHAEELIEQGTVLVNGERVELGTRVDSTLDVVTINGAVVRPEQAKLYLMLNKPIGVVSTAEDQHGRKTVLDLCPVGRERLYPVGRLDLDTAGLLLLTNDGDFAYALTHPKFKVPKTYQAWVRGVPTEQTLQRLQVGIDLDNQVTAPAEVRTLGQKSGQALIELTIHEGRKRQVRRMCGAVGHPVLSLTRVQFGCLKLGELLLGQVRQLTACEVAALLEAAGHAETQGGEC